MTNATSPDIYGQVHPVETPELLKSKLEELEVELGKIPADEKQGYTKACAQCPDLVDDDFKLSFLRADVFESHLAAKRLAKYWDVRVTVFGECAFKPLTQKDALVAEDDSIALGVGFMRLTGAKDFSGRNIIFLEPSVHDSSKYSKEALTRAAWYVMHAALEDLETQQRGWILLCDPSRLKYSQFDRDYLRMIATTMIGVIPARMSGFHMCHPPPFFQVVFPFIRFFFPQRLRKRIRVHFGTKQKVMTKLEKYGFTKETIPSELGGNLILDHAKWVEERKLAGL